MLAKVRILFADQELLLGREEIVHEDREWIDTWQLIRLHLLADQLKQVIVALLLLLPIAACEFSPTQLRKGVSKIDPHRESLLVMVYSLLKLTVLAKYIAYTRVGIVRIGVEFDRSLVVKVGLI